MPYQTPCVIQDGYTLRCPQLAVDTTGNAMWTAWILTHRDEYKSGHLINRVIPSFQDPLLRNRELSLYPICLIRTCNFKLCSTQTKNQIKLLWLLLRYIYYRLKKFPTRMRFELTRGDPNGLAVHRLNHSATSSYTTVG